MDRRVKLIFNQHADNGRGWRVASSLQATIEQMGGAEWTGTDYPTHATELALDAAKQGFDVVVAIGGDGTVHEVVNGLMQVDKVARPMLAAVPIGGGNDFSANAGVASDPTQAILNAFSGKPKPIDIGIVRDGSGRAEYWDNGLGIGLLAAAVINSHAISRIQGMAMYLAAGIMTILKDHEALNFNITLDGESLEGEYLLLELCNGPREGGGFLMAPEARIDDGSLNYMMVRSMSRAMMFRLIPELMRGTHERYEKVEPGSFRKMVLTSDRPMLVHTDGEIFANSSTNVQELTVEVIPQAIQLVS